MELTQEEFDEINRVVDSVGRDPLLPLCGTESCTLLKNRNSARRAIPCLSFDAPSRWSTRLTFNKGLAAFPLRSRESTEANNNFGADVNIYHTGVILITG